MKIPTARFLALSLVLISAVAGASAQDPRVSAAAGNDFVISATAGGVSAAEGTVRVARSGGAVERLTGRDSLAVGDRLTTGADGRAEVMLNPGSFARIGADASFEFVTTDLDNLVLKLGSGSLILEVYAGEDFSVEVRTPGAILPITRSGVFRIDVLDGGASRVSVWKGRLVVGKEKVALKGGRAMIARGTKGGIVKFDRDEKDALDLWSETRGKEAARANAKIQRKSLAGSLVSSYRSGAWDMYRSFGVWVFDPMLSRWLFLPFGSGWRSPYGHGYGYDIWSFRLPYYVYFPNPSAGGSGTGTSGGGSGGQGETPVPPGPGGWRTGTKDGGIGRDQLPAFRQFESTQRTYGGSPVVTYNDGGFRGGSTGIWGGGGQGGSGGGASDSRPSGGGQMQSASPVPSAPLPSRIGSKDDN